MCHGDRLLPSHLLFDDSLTFAKTQPSLSKSFTEGLNGTIYSMEKELILKTLKDLNDNKTRTAERLGISIRTLRNKLNDYQKHVKV
jgi:DNA-binding NtrC family response regulator